MLLVLLQPMQGLNQISPWYNVIAYLHVKLQCISTLLHAMQLQILVVKYIVMNELVVQH
jgi:hypothetical protein